MPPPGWYEDPVDAGGPLRWWDGTQWTEHTAPTGRNPQAAIERAPEATGREYPAIERAPQDSPAAPLSAPVAPEASSVPGRSVQRPRPFADRLVPEHSPFPVAGQRPSRHSELDPRARPRGDRGRWRTSAGRTGTPVTEDDTPLLERGEAAGRLRRNRTRLMWGLALGAAVAMLMTGVLVAVFGFEHGTARRSPAAARHPLAAVRTLSPKASASPPSTPSTVPTTGTPVTDPASGLSYATLSTPWQPSCPAAISNAAFTWTAGGERGGRDGPSGGRGPLDASACSGLLGQQYPYTGVADLPQTAMNLVGAFDSAYYSALPHVRATQQNNPLQVSGHPAWIVEFQMTYPTAAGQGLAWQTQLGAVVVVDRGAGQPPAVIYVTVPDNLGTANVGRDPGLDAAECRPPPRRARLPRAARRSHDRRPPRRHPLLIARRRAQPVSASPDLLPVPGNSHQPALELNL